MNEYGRIMLPAADDCGSAITEQKNSATAVQYMQTFISQYGSAKRQLELG